jgi:hypothetical protein
MQQPATVRIAARIEGVVVCVLGFALLFATHRSLSWHSRVIDERYFASPVVVIALALSIIIASDLLLWGAALAGTAAIGTRTVLVEGPLRILTGSFATVLARVPFVTSDVTPPPPRLVTVFARIVTSDMTFAVILVVATLAGFLSSRRSPVDDT